MNKFFAKIMKSAFIFILYIFSHSSLANDQSLIELSTNKQWLKLLHYKPDHSSESYITSPEFFLSSAVVSSSLEELKATIAAFSLPINKNESTDSHARCRFPARLKLIQQQLNLNVYGELPTIDCAQYKIWRQQIKDDSVSLVFASGYMSNPASMYGHILLKFSDVDGNKSNELLDTSLNYGAIVPNKENPLLYVLKGILGGYNASFSDQQFFKHKHNYGNVELRDMWEYKLSLTPEDVALIVDHLWEILPTKFDYYFVDENCAYHFAKLIELVLDEPIISDNSLWVLPNSVATGLAQATYKSTPLLAKVNFIPSRETLLLNYYQQLTVEQQQVALSIIVNDFSFAIDKYQVLNDDEKKVIVESLFQYINVVKQKEKDYEFAKTGKRKLIKERLKFPVGTAIRFNENKAHAPPHLVSKPSKFSLGIAAIDQTKFYSTAGFRMTYFDDLSSSVGRSDFSNLEMVDVEVISDGNQTKILRLDLIDISSLYLPAMPWENKVAAAWSVRAGYEQLSNACIDCGIYFAEGNLGKSVRIGNNTLGFAMMGGKAFLGKENDVTIHAKLGLLTSITKNLKAKIELQRTSNIALSSHYASSVKLAISYEFSQDWDVRFTLENKETTFAALALNYYWGF
ncbi:DUF4105 domain-containing protein [Colwellia hornerae]|uniref:Lnb N-terminal periplasmic domain-containing protein n=1 Tax=Colwellia hornerae TaxID=89402 RepID=UPI001478E730|nr:DUF4105 domain-containing protein [Colwellia hornerae]